MIFENIDFRNVEEMELGAQGNTCKKQYLHISYDDVYLCIKDIIDNTDRYDSVFENQFFAWLRSLNSRYGAVFTLNTFNSNTTEPDYDISALSSKYAKELSENSDWLKFAFHSEDEKKKYEIDETEVIKSDYMKFVSAIMNATNHNVSSIDRITRLHYYAGTEENMKALRDCEYGILGLLTADNNETRCSYYFGSEVTAQINKDGIYHDQNNQLLFLRSQHRIEGIKSIEEQIRKICEYDKVKVIELFTHESRYYSQNHVAGYTVPELIEIFIQWAYEKGYGFDYAENQYENTTFGMM